MRASSTEAEAEAAVAFLSAHRIEPDRFQIESAQAIDRGEAVVVTAPTGAGKTLIAEVRPVALRPCLSTGVPFSNEFKSSHSVD